MPQYELAQVNVARLRAPRASRNRGPGADAFTVGNMLPAPGSGETIADSLDLPCPAT